MLYLCDRNHIYAALAYAMLVLAEPRAKALILRGGQGTVLSVERPSDRYHHHLVAPVVGPR